MEYRIKTPRPWQRVLEVSVPAAQIKLEINRLAEYYSKTTRLDGFRAGKVPSQFVKARHFTKLQKEAMDKVINEAYQGALEESKLSPINYPKVSDVSFNPGGKLSFKASFEVIPDIKIKRYKNIHCVKKVRTIRKTHVDKKLQSLRESSPILKPVTRKIRLSDALVVDLKIYEKSKLVKEFAEFTIWVRNMLPEVQTKIIGKLPGDTVRLDTNRRMTKILIREVKEPLYPDLDDNFAKDLGFEDFSSLRSKIREDLKKAEELKSERELEEEILRKLIKENPFDPPPSFVEAQLDEISTKPEERENYRNQAVYLVKRSIILDKLASLEKISVSNEEIEEEIGRIAESEGIGVDRLKPQLERSGKIDILRNRIECDKVLKFLAKEASIKIEKTKE